MAEAIAVISDCGKYRYALTRGASNARFMHWIMLNPSTADAFVDDHTIRKCIGFARRLNFTGITVHNLFAVRATKPADMMAAADPVGPDNHTYIERMLSRAAFNEELVVCAWGAHGSYMDQDETVMGWIESAPIKPFCFGFCKNGTPMHPLTLGYERELIPYAGRQPCKA